MLNPNLLEQLPIGRHQHDGAAIKAGLAERAEIWVPQLFPNGWRFGKEWRLANIRGGAPRKNGSCVIDLTGPYAGHWRDWSTGEYGDAIDAIEQATGLSGFALFARAADLAGAGLGPGARRDAARPLTSRRDPTRYLMGILAETCPLSGSLAEAYLAGRGLVSPACEDIRFHPLLEHWETRTLRPAMIGVVRSANGGITGVHRTYLSKRHDGRIDKAEVERPRLSLGRLTGGAVRLGEVRDDEWLALCEGIETGLAVVVARPDLKVWACLSAGGLERFVLPPTVRRILILADNDHSGTGLRAAERAKARFRRDGQAAVITMPPRPGDDFNDLLIRDGPDAVGQLVDDAMLPPRNTTWN